MALIRILGLLLVISSAAAAQHIAPRADATCNAATIKGCPNVNWPQFHFDSAHTGFNPNETTLSPANVGNLVLDWKFETFSDAGPIWSSPAVVDGVVYFGSDRPGTVYAVYARTGAIRWRWESPSDTAGSPAVAYGKLYETDSDGNRIRVLDASNGHLLASWGYDIPTDVTVFSGAVYAASGHSGEEFGTVFALDANTGDFLWNRHMQRNLASSPAVADGRVYVECAPTQVVPDNLCALDAVTGDILWDFAPEGDWTFYQAAVLNGTVYVGASERFRLERNNSVAFLSYASAFDAETGAMLWQRPLRPSFIDNDFLPITQTTPAVANGVVYIGIAEPHNFTYGYMYAINAATGAIMWKYKTAGGIYSSAAVANGVVYFGSDDKNIYALDAGTGAVLWKYTTEAAIRSSPAVVNGMLFVGSLDTYMYAFHLPGQ